MATRLSVLVMVVVLGVLAPVVAVFAWGPMTHMAINDLAFERVRSEPGATLCFPLDMKHLFVGGGPSPDIKATAGASFPRQFHDSLDTVSRMVDIARSASSSFGLEDVVMALGYAGHVYGEVFSAHAEDGYANNKLSVVIENNVGMNHQINELAVDILAFQDLQRRQAKIGVRVPIRLLEHAMALEAAENGSYALTHHEIRTAVVRFIPTVIGIRDIAEYLLRERPDLLDEMDEFYGDRADQIDISVFHVADLLRRQGRAVMPHARVKSADSFDKRLHFSGDEDLGQQAKAVGMSVVSAVLSSNWANNAFTFLGYSLMKGAISTPLIKDRFIAAARSMGQKMVWGAGRNKDILARYVEAMLVRTDLTYPEILAYAQGDVPRDAASVVRQRSQFAASGLVDDGRKPVAAAQVAAAVAEVARLEGLRREWPWFWPWRPSVLRLAQARAKAGRLAGCFFADQAVSWVSGERVAALRTADRAFRHGIWEYQQASWWNPINKWKSGDRLEANSDQFFQDSAPMLELFNLWLQVDQGGSDPGRLQMWLVDARRQRTATAQALDESRRRLANLGSLQLIKRNRLNDEIRSLEVQLEQFERRVAALEQMISGGSAPTVAATAAASTAKSAAASALAPRAASVVIPPGMTLERAQRDYTQAYQAYQKIAAGGTATMAARTAAERVTAARDLVEALKARLSETTSGTR